MSTEIEEESQEDRKLTIVTINYNNGSGLRRTLKSVKRQGVRVSEHIIVDGGSDDNSWLAWKKEKTESTLWISEKDGGIYDAMNKGARLATGEYLMFLNSGDIFYSDSSVKFIMRHLSGNELIYGDIAVVRDGRLKRIRSTSRIEYSMHYQHDLPPQPATVYRKSLIEEKGYFDTSYKVASDVKLISSVCMNPNVRYCYIDAVLTIFDETGVSSSLVGKVRAGVERIAIVAELRMGYLPDLLCVLIGEVHKRLLALVTRFEK